MYSESIASARNRGHRVGLLDIHLLQSFIIKQFVKKFGFSLSCPTLYEGETTCTRRILDSTVIMNTLVFNMVCEWLSDNASFWKSVNDSLYDFDWVFPKIPVKNCIVGMLLACPIFVGKMSKMQNYQCFWNRNWIMRKRSSQPKP